MDYFSKILHIDIEEKASSIIERFSSLDDHDIIFAIPTGASIFQNPPELKLLKQAIDYSGKNIVLVSQDDMGLELARDLGFKVEEEFLELLSPSDENPKYSADTHMHPKIFDIIYNEKKNKLPPLRKINIQQIKPEEEVSEEVEISHREEFVEPLHRMTGPELKKKAIEFASGEQEHTKESTLKEELSQRSKSRFFTINNIIIIFIVISVIVTAVSMIAILPSATIEISPKRDIVILDLPIKADISISEVDIKQNKIPGQKAEVEKEKTSQFKATGKTNAESKAIGTIIIYNNQIPPQNQALVKTTRFQTPDGKIFRTTGNVTIPAAKIENGKIIPGTIEANVVADAPGAEYNIGPSEFTIPGFKGSQKFDAFYGKSILPMQGGSKGDSAVVTLDDIENAKKNTETELIELAKNELREKLPKDLNFIENTITAKIIEEKTSAKAGTSTENFSVTLKVSAMVFLFKEEDIKTLIEKNIETKIMRDKIDFKEIRKNYINIDSDFNTGVMSLTAHIEQDIAALINIENFKDEIAGKDESGIREYIEKQEAIDSADVSFWPKFVKKAPSNTAKIKIIMKD